jgi:3-phenylpropionate/cinnamic acid dioxygenase small subunit
VNHEEVAALVDTATRPERRRDTLEERIELAEARRAIRDLIMSYGYLEDARRWDDMLAMYTDDIERVLAGSLVETIRGKEALRDRLITPVMATKSGVASATRDQVERLGLRHLMFSDVIRIADDGRTATAAVQYVLVATRDDRDGHRRGIHEGSYVFDFRNEHGIWKFSRQLIVTNNAHNPMFRA